MNRDTSKNKTAQVRKWAPSTCTTPVVSGYRLRSAMTCNFCTDSHCEKPRQMHRPFSRAQFVIKLIYHRPCPKLFPFSTSKEWRQAATECKGAFHLRRLSSQRARASCFDTAQRATQVTPTEKNVGSPLLASRRRHNHPTMRVAVPNKSWCHDGSIWRRER